MQLAVAQIASTVFGTAPLFDGLLAGLPEWPSLFSFRWLQPSFVLPV